MTKIGVFDSGIGGLSVAKAVEQALPAAKVLFVNDTAHMPYGTKSPEEIYTLILPIFTDLVHQGCDAIVVACNTVSTTLSGRLRAQFPEVPFVALDPMVKPAAAMTKTGIIAVCATPTTLASERYTQLKHKFARDIRVIEPDCSEWAHLIEHSHMNEAKIRAGLEPALDAGADVLVLACTHYHWIEQEIQQIAGTTTKVLQPEAAVVAQLKRTLQLH